MVITSILSNGTTHDVKVAPNLIDKIDLSDTDILCADKGYDSETLREYSRSRLRLYLVEIMNVQQTLVSLYL
ncbi:hypothetical protein RCH20_001791 [Psychrobacter sp. PL15]|nr:hypothetical protein [Psychrobacter sp. PL15]